MDIKTISLGVCGANCYIVSDEDKNCFVVDAPDRADVIYEYIKKSGLNLKAVFVTHAHFDHIFALNDLLEMAGNDGLDIKVYVHEKDESAMRDTEKNLSSNLFYNPFVFEGKSILVSDGEKINVGKFSLEIMHTPGHTSGSMCVICPDEKVIFSGDTIFLESCGRVDFEGGSACDMRQSLKKIVGLPEDYRIYSGHGEYTTILHERQYNPYISI